MGDYYVADGARVGEGCSFGHGAIVEEGAFIGDRVNIGPNAVVLQDAMLGDEVEVAAGAVLGKPPKGSKSSARKAGPGGPLVIGSGTVIGASAVIYSRNEFAENCYIGDLAAIREGCRFGQGTVVGRLASIEYETVLGERVRLQTGAHITGYAEIQDDVFVGALVVTTNDRYMSMKEEKVYKGPLIMKGAAVGAGANLLAGVTIGEGAVVGMGAVVVKDVPDGRVYVGVPARDVGPVRSG